MRIHRLPDRLVNKIAAGEVVERPARWSRSWWRTRSTPGRARRVVVRGAGRQLIAVTDDGRGMTAEELPPRARASRHLEAPDGEDLDAIATLGFRGEALPAICAVSRLSLLSPRRPAPPRAPPRRRGRGGRRGEPGRRAARHDRRGAGPLLQHARPGSSSSRRPATELTASVRVVTQLALAHPGVQLRLPCERPGAAERAARRAGCASGSARSTGSDWPRDSSRWTGEGGGAHVAGVIAPPDARARQPRRHHVHRQRTPGAGHRADCRPCSRPTGRSCRATVPARGDRARRRPGRGRRQRPPDQGLGAVPAPARAVRRLLDAVKAALRQLDAAPAGLSTRLAGSDAEMAGAVLPAPGDGLAAPDWRRRGSRPGVALSRGRDGLPQRALLRARRRPDPGHLHRGATGGRGVLPRPARRPRARAVRAAARPARPAGRWPRRRCSSRSRSSWPRRGSARSSASQPRSSASASRRGIRRTRARPARGARAAQGRRAPAADRRRRAGARRGRAGRASSPLLDRPLAFVACRAAIKAHQPLAPEEMSAVLTDLAETATPYFCPHGRPIVSSRIPLREIKRELRRTW